MPELRQLPSAKWTGAQMHPLLSPFPPSPRETLYYVLLSTRVRGEHRSESPRAAQRFIPGNPYEKLSKAIILKPFGALEHPGHLWAAPATLSRVGQREETL